MQSKDMENLNSLLPISENNGKKRLTQELYMLSWGVSVISQIGLKIG